MPQTLMGAGRQVGAGDLFEDVKPVQGPPSGSDGSLVSAGGPAGQMPDVPLGLNEVAADCDGGAMGADVQHLQQPITGGVILPALPARRGLESILAPAGRRSGLQQAGDCAEPLVERARSGPTGGGDA